VQGFDIVVEATGSPKILEDAIHYVRRGGKLVVYGVYSNAARVSWPPSKIFGDEITIIGSFSETFQFPNGHPTCKAVELMLALAYLDSGKVKVEGIVNKTFTINQWDECLEAMRNKTAIKVLLKRGWAANGRLLSYGSKLDVNHAFFFTCSYLADYIKGMKLFPPQSSVFLG